jgi:hypothetical protein
MSPAAASVSVVPIGRFRFGVACSSPSQLTLQRATHLGESSAAEVFPLSFESDVSPVGGPFGGDLTGFVVLEDFKTMRTRGHRVTPNRLQRTVITATRARRELVISLCTRCDALRETACRR